MEKGKAGQWVVFAYGLPDHANAGKPITGDAANITANLRIDSGASSALTDVNPVEQGNGYYVFDITSGESGGDLLLLLPESSTTDVQVIAAPGVIYTRPPNFNALGIAADGDISGNVDGSVASVASAVETDSASRTASKATGFSTFDPTSDTVVNVTNVTNNADMRGTDSANTATPDNAGIATLVTQVGTAGAGLTNINLPNQTMNITGNVSGSVGSVVATVSADVLSLDGDVVSLGNLKSTYDGSGYADDAAPATQAQISKLPTGSAAISTSAELAVVTIGTETLTFNASANRDGSYHEIADVGGAMDFYYQFDIGATGVGTSVNLVGRLEGNGDSVSLFAYNWLGASWDPIGVFVGSNSNTDVEADVNINLSHTGASANEGKVRVRAFAASGLSSAVLYMDQIYINYATIADTTDLATASALSVVDGNVDSILNNTSELQGNQADWATATGFATVNPDNASITAIKSKTDALTFTIANEVDVNTKSINNATVTGSGTNVDPWT